VICYIILYYIIYYITLYIITCDICPPQGRRGAEAPDLPRPGDILYYIILYYIILYYKHVIYARLKGAAELKRQTYRALVLLTRLDKFLTSIDQSFTSF
jgi:hypothetical protein